MTDYASASRHLEEIAETFDQHGLYDEADIVTACLRSCAARGMLISARDFYLRTAGNTRGPMGTQRARDQSPPTAPVPQVSPAGNPLIAPVPSGFDPADDAAQTLMGGGGGGGRVRVRGNGIPAEESELPAGSKPRFKITKRGLIGGAMIGAGLLGAGGLVAMGLNQSNQAGSAAQSNQPAVTQTPSGQPTAPTTKPNQQYINQYGNKETLALGYGYDILMRTRSYPSAIQILKQALSVGIQGQTFTPQEQNKALQDFKSKFSAEQYVQKNMMQAKPVSRQQMNQWPAQRAKQFPGK